MDQQYADYVGSTRERNYLDLENERYHFCGGRKFAWRDVLVDETLAPTSRAQAQNPDWSNYKWNQGDVVTEQLNASNRIAENKAKLCVFVATTATSTKNPVPTWMMQNNSFYGTNLTWRDGQGKDHVRLDKPGGYQATADFLMAVTKKYGDDPRIASITHGEYYTNADAGGLPADFDDAAFKNNAELIWQGVIAAAPRDANGERVNFVQSMPQTSGGHTTAAEIRAIGVGVSGSDLFNEGPVQRLQNVLYGVVPLQQRRGRSRGSEIGPNNGTSSL